MKTWFWIIGWFLTILTTTGNGFIIFLVCCKRQLRTKTNAFVVSLAVADFCVGMTAVPLLFLSREAHSEEQLPADVEHFVTWFFMDVSVTNMCSLVLDRYMAVVRPLKYLTFMKHRRVIQIVSLSWVIPFAFIMVKSLLLVSFKGSVIISIFFWLSMIFFQFFPCFMIIFCFGSMLRVVCKHDRAARTLAKQLRFNNHALCKPQEKTAVKIMAIVISVFLLCCGIQLRCGFKIALQNHLDQLCNVLHLQVLTVVLNSAVNPLAYALFKRDIKKELNRLICFVTLRKQNYLS